MLNKIKKPEVSILMPVFNGDKYIKESIISIIEQSYDNFEFIIIDDGSTDNTYPIIEQYAKKDSRIRFFRNNKNIGLSASLNLGLKLACTSLIARMDADDVAHPQRLSRQYEFMKTHPEISVCGCALQLYESPEIVWHPPRAHQEIVTKMLFESSIFHPTVLFRKEIVFKQHGGYAPEFYSAQDYDLWQRLSESPNVRFANLPEVLLLYRNHPHVDRSTYKIKQQQLANLVRFRQLKRLKLDPNEHELACHKAISCPKLTLLTPSDLKGCRSWIDRIESANNKYKAFPALYLSKELEKRWLNLCLQVSHQSLSVPLDYIKGRHQSKPLDNIYQMTRMVWRSCKNRMTRNV